MKKPQKPKKIIIYDDDPYEKPQEVILPCSDEEINLFMTAISNLNTIHDARALGSIIQKYQPEMIPGNEQEVEIDLGKLAPMTIKELIKYTKERYKKQKKEYPT